jgi:hypothetical protein
MRETTNLRGSLHWIEVAGWGLIGIGLSSFFRGLFW